MGIVNAKSDTERYRLGYPGQIDDIDEDNNLKFYRNEISSSPRGYYFFFLFFSFFFNNFLIISNI